MLTGMRIDHASEFGEWRTRHLHDTGCGTRKHSSDAYGDFSGRHDPIGGGRDNDCSASADFGLRISERHQRRCQHGIWVHRHCS